MTPPEKCQWWIVTNVEGLNAEKRYFLKSVLESPFKPFTGPAGLIGGRSEQRDVYVFFRGRRRMLAVWEIVLEEVGQLKFESFTSDIEVTTSASLKWLSGDSLPSVIELVKPVMINPRLNRS